MPRKQVEQDVELPAVLSDENPNPVLRAKKNGVLLYANPASKPLLEHWGCNVNEVLPASWKKRITATINNLTPSKVEEVCGKRVFSIQVVPCRDVYCVYLFGQDVTERKQAEQALLNSEERFRSLYENSTVGLYRTTPDGCILMANPTLVRMLGYLTWEELKARNLEKDGFEPAYPRTQFLDAIEKDGEIYGLDADWERRDGTRIFVRESARAIRDAGGKTLFYDGVVEDITERKQAEKALRESEMRFAAIFHANPGAVALTRVSDNQLIDVNKAWLEVTGYSREEAIGHTAFELNLWIDAAQRDQLIEMIRTQGKGHGEVQLRHKSGEVQALLMSAELLELSGERYLLTMAQDITERKRIDLEIYQRNQELALLNAINSAANRGEDLGGIINIIANGTKNLIPNSGVILSLVNASGDRLVSQNMGLSSSAQARIEKLVGRPIPNFSHDLYKIPHYQKVKESRKGLLLTEKKAIDEFFCAYIEATSWPGKTRQAVKKLLPALEKIIGLRSVLVVPLISGDEMIGILETASSNVFGEVHLHRLEVLAAQVTTVIQRKQAEEALRESEKLLRKIAANYPNSYLSIIEKDMTISFSSGQEFNKQGLDPNKFFGLTLEQVFGEKAPMIRENYRKVFGGSEVEFEMFFNDQHQLYRVLPLPDDDGKIERILAVVENITERKQAEEALRESNKLLSEFIKNSPVYTFIKEVNAAESRVLVASENFQDMIGIPGSKMTGRTMEELFPPEFAAKISADDWAVVLAGKVLRLDESLNDRHYTTIKFPITQGGKKLLAGYTIDITERKQAEEALRVLSSRQEALLAAVPDIVMEVDNRKVYTWANPAGLEFFGPEVLGREAADYFEGEQQTYRSVKPLFNGDENTIYVESWQRRKDGQKRLLAWWCRTLKDAQGNVIGALSSARDITEQRKAEENLNRLYERFALATQTAQMGVWDWDISNNILVWDDQMYALYGIKKEDFGGAYESWLNGLHPDDRARSDELEKQALRGEREYDAEFRVVWPDGSIHILKANGHVFFGEDGKPLRMLGVNYDITERKQAEEAIHNYSGRLEEMVAESTRELRETQEQLVRQEKLAVLGHLAGGVGHELRNPLAVIYNAVYYLKLIQPEADEKVKEYLGLIEKETHTAEKIITDLLDFSRVKSVDREPISAAELANRVLERFPAPENVRVQLKFTASLPKVFADPRQMDQVLGNLVVNACQAMPKGGTLTLSAVKKGREVAIAVKDSGEGILPENMGKLFEPLFTTKPKGIGLGLAVCKKLIEANDGRIEVQSEAGKGSTFTLHLPTCEEKA
jgi:PAS domain S-box-containing protein